MKNQKGFTLIEIIM
ncbi:MAG: prepilin-type N-terminal cleavage/methylation domain-containing protein, partial [Candidatus Marinimicrobia bacterium]|nr:prepilin-type N-terminal cleavage/methylation domain-containing protein [Candidatus Neomarinimicrobiota bacterium]